MADVGKIALVTGAGTGVGRSTALAFLNAGYSVVLTGRREEPLQETADMSGAPDDRILIKTCDVGKAEEVAELFAATKERFGRLDVLFNNAGAGTPPLTIDEMTPEQWQMVVDVNLTGSFLCAREAFAMMRAQDPQGGRIINNGSISSQVPRPGSAAYTATKQQSLGDSLDFPDSHFAATLCIGRFGPGSAVAAGPFAGHSFAAAEVAAAAHGPGATAS